MAPNVFSPKILIEATLKIPGPEERAQK